VTNHPDPSVIGPTRSIEYGWIEFHAKLSNIDILSADDVETLVQEVINRNKLVTIQNRYIEEAWKTLKENNFDKQDILGTTETAAQSESVASETKPKKTKKPKKPKKNKEKEQKTQKKKRRQNYTLEEKISLRDALMRNSENALVVQEEAHLRVLIKRIKSDPLCQAIKDIPDKSLLECWKNIKRVNARNKRPEQWLLGDKEPSSDSSSSSEEISENEESEKEEPSGSEESESDA
jgi:hypothetical protein